MSIKEVPSIGVNSLSADQTLENAMGNYQDVLTIGWDLDGELKIFSSSAMDRVDKINHIVSQFQHELLAGRFSDD